MTERVSLTLNGRQVHWTLPTAVVVSLAQYLVATFGPAEEG